MSEWIRAQLGQLTSSYAGGTPNRNNLEYFGGTIPWVKSTEVNLGRILSTEESITEKGLKFSAAKWIPSQTVLLALYGATAAQVAFLEIEATANQAVLAILTTSEKLNSRFLFYLLTSLKSKLLYLAQGSGQPNLNKQIVDAFCVDLPTLPEQQRIVTILSTIDRAIAHTEALIEKYQQIKVGLMNDLFTRGIGADGKLRPPREEAPELYQESAIGWIPREWKVELITSCADVVDPNPSHRNPIYHSEGFPFISTVEFAKFDQIQLDTSRRVVEEIVLEQERRCKFSEYSIAFSRKGTIGETRFLPSHLRFALLDSLCVINPVEISPSFLFYSLRSHFLKKQIKNMTMGQALPQMSIGRVRELFIPVPQTINEQQEIELKLISIDRYVLKSAEDLQKLGFRKTGLMHDLLTGKVSVKVEPDEVTNA
jgi:type I restriction enzyme, S subunit